nr:phosphodiester glycosidase family protein [Nocardioides luti]
MTAPALAGPGDLRAGHAAAADRHHPGASSGRDPGTGALPIPQALRGPTTTSGTVSWPVAPGVTYTRWERNDARGPVRVHLLSVNPAEPGVQLDYAGPARVRRTARVVDLLARDAAVAGVNGDFYDIGHTGAPLGLGRDRQRGLLHGRQSGWNAAFYLDAAGVPQIGEITLTTRMAQHPRLPITNLNSPFVRPGGIGVYTRRWGRAAGYEVTDGRRTHVRAVQVRGGVVRSTSTTLTHGRPVRGTLLVGRGEGARQLRRLQPGDPVTLTHALDPDPQVAITGSTILVDEGVIQVTADRVQHPRTAVGIDRDTGEVLIVVVDGRSKASRGATLAELADLMIDLGADEALNLDGGGSSTMVATKPGGSPAVRNHPSDGFQRSVANALEVTWTDPS